MAFGDLAAWVEPTLGRVAHWGIFSLENPACYY